MPVESQAARVDREPFIKCVSDDYCIKIKFPCPPDMFSECQFDRCGCGN